MKMLVNTKENNYDFISTGFYPIVFWYGFNVYLRLSTYSNLERGFLFSGHGVYRQCARSWHSLIRYRLGREIQMSKTLVATTQEVGGSLWATLDCAFQAESFEPYETFILAIEEHLNELRKETERKVVVGRKFNYSKVLPNRDKYTLEMVCEQDITNEDEGFDAFLWRINLYKENLNDLMNEAEPKEYTQDLGSLRVTEQDVKEIEEDWYAWILKQAKDGCIEADGLFDEDGKRV